MARVIVSGPADADVGGVVAYLAEKAGRQVAARYFAAFDMVYARLADFPDMGPSRPALGPNARAVLVHPFVVIYDHADDTVTVLRVLHGRRNITQELLDR